jgi:Peptidase inhibitor family I36
MYTVPVSRKVLLSALAALTLLAAVLLAGAPKASASLDQCSDGTVCVWSQTNFGGDFSYWASSDTGCKDHAGIDVRAVWNRTGYTVTIPGRGVSIPSGGQATFDQAVTGSICWG